MREGDGGWGDKEGELVIWRGEGRERKNEEKEFGL
jgi:hypothetical protein